MSNKHKTLMTFVLDESGSMASVYEATISGFNEFLDSQRDRSLGECRVTLVKFNGDRIETMYNDRHIDDVKPLTRQEYGPASVTPLYDAIGQAIRETEEKYKASVDVLKAVTGSDGAAAIPLVIMIIMTDGLENASRKYNQKAIFDMISQKKDDGWAFVFLGSDQDSWAAARPLGFDPGNIANYDSGQTRRAFVGVSQATSDYRMAAGTAINNLSRSLSNTADDKEKMELVAQASETLTGLRKNFWKGKKEL